MTATVKVIGGGLAGSEAAWQIAKRGVPVTLYEMRPQRSTGAHHTDLLGELVCSNSLRARSTENAVGLLKEEMRLLGSLIFEAAHRTEVPAGGALAVDREEFSQYITEKLGSHPLITVLREEVLRIPEGLVVIASGPLTSNAFADHLRAQLGQEYLAFYDAAAPIVTRDSIDMESAFFASRYDKGEAAYLNCPLTEQEYEAFYDALLTAERQEVKGVDRGSYFEGCMPVEALAERGPRTLLFGPLKPVGLVDPKTERRPFAVVQLRQDNRAATLYNMVGFQTRLKWSEQKRVFSMIPALASAEFVRYGVMHRNTFINSRRLLAPTMEWKGRRGVFFSGQLTGVEGYVESAASGLIAGINAARRALSLEPLAIPAETAHGALLNYITEDVDGELQPMNVTFGLFPPLPSPPRDRKKRNEAYAERALAELTEFFNKENEDCLYT
jgi:methylenetetrahydrofolate--tRNA-(uracil-5-)-methyltransferase